MPEHGLTPEHAVYVTQAALGLFALAQAYSTSQRGAILYRDNKQCQMDCEAAKFCGGKKDRPQVHHVRPQRWMKDHGMPDSEIDSARNGISLCTEFHQKEVHGFRNGEVQRRVRMGLPYWNTKHDLFLAQKAEKNTREVEADGWEFPPNNRTKKKKKKWGKK